MARIEARATRFRVGRDHLRAAPPERADDRDGCPASSVGYQDASHQELDPFLRSETAAPRVRLDPGDHVARHRLDGAARVDDRESVEDLSELQILSPTSLEGLDGSFTLAFEQDLCRSVEIDDEVRLGIQTREHESVQPPARSASRLGCDVVREVVGEEVPVEDDDVSAATMKGCEDRAMPLLGEAVAEADE